MSEKEKEFELIWQTYSSNQHENNYFVAISMFKASEHDLMDFCKWLYDTYCDAENHKTYYSIFEFKLSNSNFYYTRERRLCMGQHIETQRCYEISIEIKNIAWGSPNVPSHYIKPQKVLWGVSNEEKIQSIKMIHETLYFLWKY